MLFLYAYALGATTFLLGGILEAVFASSWRDRAWHVGFGVVSGLLWPLLLAGAAWSTMRSRERGPQE